MPDIEICSRQERPGEDNFAENIALGDVAEKMEVAPTNRLLERRAGTFTNAIRKESRIGSCGSSFSGRNSSGR